MQWSKMYSGSAWISALQTELALRMSSDVISALTGMKQLQYETQDVFITAAQVESTYHQSDFLATLTTTGDCKVVNTTFS